MTRRGKGVESSFDASAQIHDRLIKTCIVFGKNVAYVDDSRAIYRYGGIVVAMYPKFSRRFVSNASFGLTSGIIRSDELREI